MPTLRLRELLCFLLLAGVAAPASGTPPNTTASCPSYRCGHTVDIRYPFWIGGGGGGMHTSGGMLESHCGYPSLRLECRGGTPVLRLPSGDYSVTRIQYGENSAGDRTLTVFDLAVSMNGSCPLVAGRNLTLPGGSPPPLSLTHRDTNLAFYTNCSFRGLPSQVVPCLESADGWHHTYVFRDSDYPMPYSYSKLCGGVVGIPVLRRSMENSTGPLDSVMPALIKGFELRWRPALGGECGECEMGGGHCGQQHDAFAWFGRTAVDISTSSSRGSKKIGGVIALIIIGAILLCMIIALSVILIGRKRQTEADHERASENSSVYSMALTMLSGR